MLSTTRRHFLTIATTAFLAAMTTMGCSSDTTTTSSSPQPGTGQVEIFSWWTAGGEEEALKVITDDFKTRYPKATLINAAVVGGSGTKAREELKKRMSDNLPPDTFQAHGGRELIGTYVRPRGITDDSANKMEDLTFLFTEQGWLSAFPKQLIDIVSFEGKIYSVPVNIHKGNSVFYNKKVFADNNITPPKTFADLYTVATALQAKGITPIAIGTRDSWPITMIFDNIILAKGGAAFFKDYFAGKKAADDPVIKDSLEEMKKVIDIMNTDSATLSWDDAADRVAKGTAAMTFMGDWAKGFFTSEKGGKLVPDQDFGEFNSPGTDNAFVVVTDTFGLPKGAPARANAVALLKVVGDKTVQTNFSLKKGSIPARKDIDASSFDSIGKATIQEFATADLVPSFAHGSAADEEFATPINSAIATFFKDKDSDKLLGVLRTNFARLR